ncbi:MAG: hypothetical protein ISS19_18270, partial [Bacteroidales bacterium]|nr:hypothetical protein [Bacteroidales bacterium]
MKRMNLTQQAFTIALAMVMMILTWAEADAQAYQLIIGHPRDVVVEEGQVDTVTFTVEAVPGTPVTYQWFMQAPAQALPDPVKEAISPVLEMSAKEAYGLDGYRFFCEVTFEMLIENSLPAYITASLPRVMILKHPQDVIEAEGFTGDVAYGVDLIPGIEPKIYWYIRLPGKNWEEYSTG